MFKAWHDIWDIATKSVRATLPGHPGSKSLRLSANDDGTLLASCAPDGKTFEWKLWDVNQQVELRCVTASGELQNLKLSGDSRLLATCGASQVVIWDTATGQERHTLSGFVGPATPLAFSPDGQILATGGTGVGKASIQLWQAGTAKATRAFQQERGRLRGDIVFSPGGKFLAVANGNGTAYVLQSSVP